MMDDVIASMKFYVDFYGRLRGQYQSELDQLPSGSLCQKRIDKRNYYYHQIYIEQDGRRRQIQKAIGRDEKEKVYLLKRKRFI